MNLKQALSARLLATAGVGDRVYPLVLPQKPTYPAITYQVISDVAERALAGVARRQARVQLSCWGLTYAEASDLAARLDSLQDFQGELAPGGPYVLNCEVKNQSDGFESRTSVYHVPVDALILYRGGA